MSRKNYKDVEFLTDDEDDFEPNVSTTNNESEDNEKDDYKLIPKYGKRKGVFNWDSFKSNKPSKIKKELNVNSQIHSTDVIEITDDESEDSSMSGKRLRLGNLKVKIESPQVLIHNRLMISMVNVDLPVKPYPCQIAVMNMVIIYNFFPKMY